MAITMQTIVTWFRWGFFALSSALNASLIMATIAVHNWRATKVKQLFSISHPKQTCATHNRNVDKIDLDSQNFVGERTISENFEENWTEDEETKKCQATQLQIEWIFKKVMMLQITIISLAHTLTLIRTLHMKSKVRSDPCCPCCNRWLEKEFRCFRIRFFNFISFRTVLDGTTFPWLRTKIHGARAHCYYIKKTKKASKVKNGWADEMEKCDH